MLTRFHWRTGATTSSPSSASISHQVNKYAKELLAAMSSGMEEKDDPGNLTAKTSHKQENEKLP